MKCVLMCQLEFDLVWQMLHQVTLPSVVMPRSGLVQFKGHIT